MIVVAGAAPSVTRGEDADGPPRALVVISGPRGGSFESSADSTGFSEVIETREAWRGYQTVGELLEHGVGIQVRRFGGREDFSTVSIRGSTPAQVKILIDGVSVSRASNDVVNLADLPMDAVERIEVYRGFTPVQFASSGAASVINIITRRGEAGEVGGSVSYGSFDAAKASLHAAAGLGSGVLSAFLTYRRTDGNFEFFDDNDTPFDPGDDARSRRSNNDSESYDLLLRYVAALPRDSQLTLTGSTYYKDRGAPGRGANESELTRIRATRAIMSGVWESRENTRLSADLTILDERVRDPTPAASGPDDTAEGLFPYAKADNTTLAGTVEASTVRSWGRYHLLEGGVETTFERFEGRTRDGDSTARRSSDQERNRLAIAGGDEIFLPGLALAVSLQLRAEAVWNRFDGGGLSRPVPEEQLPDDAEASLDPRAGLRWEPLPFLTVKGNLGTYFRPPNFTELFGDDGFSAANPTLDAEQGINRDIGFLARARRFGVLVNPTLEYAYFNNDVDDMIVFIASGARIPTAQNVDQSRVRGHEIRVAASGPAGLSFEANYTRQVAENRSALLDSSGNDVPGLPRDEAYARLGLDRARWSLAYELGHRGRVFLDTANFQQVPSRNTHDVTLTLRPANAAFEIKLEGENLGDEQVSDVVGFPVPGRTFFVTLSYSGAVGRAAGDGNANGALR